MNYNLSLREQIAENVVKIINELDNPHIRLVTREPFEPDKLAITQFPAVLVQMDSEDRETITMGMSGTGRRMGTINYIIRGYVRGTELDKARNKLINGIELVLDEDRYLGLATSGVTDSQLTSIEVVNRLAPLAEIRIEFEVKYNYIRGAS
jgi:hypothetical protein